MVCVLNVDKLWSFFYRNSTAVKFQDMGSAVLPVPNVKFTPEQTPLSAGVGIDPYLTYFCITFSLKVVPGITT